MQVNQMVKVFLLHAIFSNADSQLLILNNTVAKI